MKPVGLGQPFAGSAEARLDWCVAALKQVEQASRENVAATTAIKAITALGNAGNVQQALEALQPLQSMLTALGALADPDTDSIPFWDDSESGFDWAAVSAYVRTLLDDADAGAVLTTLGVSSEAQSALADISTVLDSNQVYQIGQTAATAPGVGNTVAGGAINGSGQLYLSINGVAAYMSRNFSNGDLLSCRRSGTQVGSISVTAGATQFNTTSDRDLKTDIVDADIAASAARIMAIRLREYTWKADGSRHYGIVTDELQQVVPHAVTGNRGDVEETWAIGTEGDVATFVRGKDETGLDVLSREIPRETHLHKLGEERKYQMWDRSSLVPDLIGAAQSMMTEIASLKSEVADLKAEVESPTPTRFP